MRVSTNKAKGQTGGATIFPPDNVSTTNNTLDREEMHKLMIACIKCKSYNPELNSPLSRGSQLDKQSHAAGLTNGCFALYATSIR